MKRKAQPHHLEALPAPTHALIYLRVSTDRQKDSGVGEDMQLMRCRAMVEFRGWTEAGVFRDLAVSGVEDIQRRPGMTQMLERYREFPPGTSVVVSYDLKRLGRRSRIVLNLIDPMGPYGIQIATTKEMFDTSTPHGRFFIHMHAAMAELDWEDIRERNMAMQAAVVARGGKLGRKHVLTPELAQKVRKMRESGEFSSLKAIADALNAAGTPSPAGGRWHETTVRRALAANLSPESDSL